MASIRFVTPSQRAWIVREPPSSVSDGMNSRERTGKFRPEPDRSTTATSRHSYPSWLSAPKKSFPLQRLTPTGCGFDPEFSSRTSAFSAT